MTSSELADNQEGGDTGAARGLAPATSIYKSNKGRYDGDHRATIPVSGDLPEDRPDETYGWRRKITRSILDRYTPRSQIVEALNAFRFAESRRMPLNCFVTILFRHHRHWRAGVRNPSTLRQMAGRVRDSIAHTIRDFCNRHGFEATYVRAIENTPGGGHGLHAHYLMHIPPGRWDELIPALDSCLKGILSPDGVRMQEDASLKAAAGSTASKVWLPILISRPSKPLSQTARENELAYSCGSISPEEPITVRGKTAPVRDHADAVKLKECGNAWTRRRIASSRSLGKAARRKAGWQERDDLSWLMRDARRKQLQQDVFAALERLQGHLLTQTESR